MNYKLIVGNSKHTPEIEDDSVDLIFTSPPYYNVKDYSKSDSCIGEDRSYINYLLQMKDVFQECYRVLRVGRYCIINISDVVQATMKINHKYPIPYDFVNILKSKDVGFTYRDNIIWSKPRGAGSSKTFGVMIQQQCPLYYHPNNLYEHNLVFRKGHFSLLPTSKEFKDKNKINLNELKGFETDVWNICPESDSDHPAIFPLKLPLMFIKLYSFKNDLIYDPFLGSGTTMKACKLTQRNCIGTEINKNYVNKIKEKTGWNQQTLTEPNKYEIIYQIDYV